MYPEGTTKIYSNLTPRSSRIPGIKGIVVFGIQAFILKYLIEDWDENFFGKGINPMSFSSIESEREFCIKPYMRTIEACLGKGTITQEHLEKLWDLQYLPLRIKALPEGTICPIGVPCLTITNTVDHAYWLVNYLETLLCCSTWQAMTSATIAFEYKKLLTKYALETTGSTDFVQWQGHDFSMRGMSSLESACHSGGGHLLSFTGTDTIPAISWLESYYAADVTEELVGASVPATEHSVMCMGTKDDELGTFRSLLAKYPTGILSVVSDTWDLWLVLTKLLPALRDDILKRDGRLVIRPDSGDPVEILCGIEVEDLTRFKWSDIASCEEDMLELIRERVRSETEHGQCGADKETAYFKWHGKTYKIVISFCWGRHDKQYYYLSDAYVRSCEEVELTAAQKGVIESLWDLFGGEIVTGTDGNTYKQLDAHIGAIYGDSITLDRAKTICERLKAKGFTSTNVVLGIGSYTYQYNTRDTFGFAMKATYGEVEVPSHGSNEQPGPVEIEAREIFKNPVTDSGIKKSAKGLLMVAHTSVASGGSTYTLIDQATPEMEAKGALETVFLDGKLVKKHKLSEIRDRLNKQL